MKLNISRHHCCNQLAQSQHHHLMDYPTHFPTVFLFLTWPSTIFLHQKPEWLFKTGRQIMWLCCSKTPVYVPPNLGLKSSLYHSLRDSTWPGSRLPLLLGLQALPFTMLQLLLCCPSETRSTLWPPAPCPYISLCLEYPSSRHLHDRLPLISQSSLVKHHLPERPFPRPTVLVRGFPGCETFHVSTRTILGKPGWLNTLQYQSHPFLIHIFLLYILLYHCLTPYLTTLCLFFVLNLNIGSARAKTTLIHSESLSSRSEPGIGLELSTYVANESRMNW